MVAVTTPVTIKMISMYVAITGLSMKPGRARASASLRRADRASSAPTPFVALALPPPASACHVMSLFCDAPGSGLARADGRPVVLQADDDPALRRTRRPDLRRTHRLGHAEEDRHSLAAAARRERLVRNPEAAVDVLPVVHHPHVPGRSDREIGLHLEPAAHVPAGRRDLVSGLEAGRAVLRAHAAELSDRAVGHREIGDPDVVVTIDDHSPGPGEAAARERRAGILRAVRPQQGDAAVPALLLGDGPCHVLRGRLQPLEPMAEPVGNPYVALTVDVHGAVADSGLEVFGHARIRGREARHFIAG